MIFQSVFEDNVTLRQFDLGHKSIDGPAMNANAVLAWADADPSHNLHLATFGRYQEWRSAFGDEHTNQCFRESRRQRTTRI